MSELAFESAELGLSEAEKAGCRLDLRYIGAVPVSQLIAGLRKHGHKVDGFVEAARLLPLDQYYRVVEVYKSLPDRPRGKIRRKR